LASVWVVAREWVSELAMALESGSGSEWVSELVSGLEWVSASVSASEWESVSGLEWVSGSVSALEWESVSGLELVLALASELVSEWALESEWVSAQVGTPRYPGERRATHGAGRW
jgi:hypothetical protein